MSRGQRPYVAELALDEALDVTVAANDTIARMRAALADGEVDSVEWAGILAAAQRTASEAAEVVEVAQQSLLAVKLADNLLRGGVTEHVAPHCRAAGIVVQFPTRAPGAA